MHCVDVCGTVIIRSYEGARSLHPRARAARGRSKGDGSARLYDDNILVYDHARIARGGPDRNVSVHFCGSCVLAYDHTCSLQDRSGMDSDKAPLKTKDGFDPSEASGDVSVHSYENNILPFSQRAR